MTSAKWTNECFVCDSVLTKDESDICDNCFATMEMNIWITREEETTK